MDNASMETASTDVLTRNRARAFDELADELDRARGEINRLKAAIRWIDGAWRATASRAVADAIADAVALVAEGETGPIPATLTVEEARSRRVCRICRKPIEVPGPEGWPLLFEAMEWPQKLTLNCGEEFAHTACLETTEITPE